jgi:excisionase family DNA binding protein
MRARLHASSAATADEGRAASITQEEQKAATTKTQPLNYSVTMLAKRWNCSQGKVRSILAKAALPHFRVGTLVRIRAVDVHAYEEQCRIEAKPDKAP